jgi:hypothetical protein
MNWPFFDPQNLAVFTQSDVLSGKEFIYYASHEEDEDGSTWQFLTQAGPASEAEARMVALKEICELDPTIIELASLPIGWCAWRDNPQSEWNRECGDRRSS